MSRQKKDLLIVIHNKTPNYLIFIKLNKKNEFKVILNI